MESEASTKIFSQLNAEHTLENLPQFYFNEIFHDKFGAVFYMRHFYLKNLNVILIIYHNNGNEILIIKVSYFLNA